MIIFLEKKFFMIFSFLCYLTCLETVKNIYFSGPNVLCRTLCGIIHALQSCLHAD